MIAPPRGKVNRCTKKSRRDFFLDFYGRLYYNIGNDLGGNRRAEYYRSDGSSYLCRAAGAPFPPDGQDGKRGFYPRNVRTRQRPLRRGAAKPQDPSAHAGRRTAGRNCQLYLLLSSLSHLAPARRTDKKTGSGRKIQGNARARRGRLHRHQRAPERGEDLQHLRIFPRDRRLQHGVQLFFIHFGQL